MVTTPIPPMLPPGLRGVGADDIVGLTKKAVPKYSRTDTVNPKAAVEAKVSGPSIFSWMWQMTEGAFSWVANLPIITIPIGILSWAVGGVGKGVNKLVPGYGDRLTKAGKIIYTPVEALDYSFKTVAEKLPAIGTPIGEAVQHVANISAKSIADLGHRTGITGLLSRFHTGRAEKAFNGIRKLPAISLTEVPDVLHGHMNTILSVKDANALRTAAGEITAYASSADAKALPKNLYKLAQHAENAAHHATQVGVYQNVAQSIKAAPGKMSALPMGHTAVNAAFVGVSALSMFGVAGSFTQQLSSLKRMYADITDQDVRNVSTLKVLTSRLPGPVAEARSKLMQSAGIQGVIQAAWLGYSVMDLVRRKPVSPIQMGVMMGAPALMMAFAPENVLPVYEAFSNAYNSGQKIPTQFYAEFVGAASKDLRAVGGAGSRFAKAIAEQYATERAAPKAILKEIANGQLKARIDKLIASHEAQHPQPQGAHSHVQGLDKKKERPIVGQHTETVVKRDATHEQGAAPTL